MIPGTEWPAYRFGKLFFTPDEAPEGCVFCGLHVEKGLGQGAADGYPSARGRRLLMDDDWLWHGFVQDVRAGKFSGAVAVLEQKVSSPVLLRCQAGPVLDPDSFDPQSPRPVWDMIFFSASDETLSLRHHEKRTDLLDRVAQANTLPKMMAALLSLPRPDWVWVDLFVGIYLALAGEAPGPEAWDVATLWERALSPWEPWFR